MGGLRGERGSALILLLIVTVVLQIVAVALLTNALTEGRIARQQEIGAGLHCIAEAGLEEAIAVKRKDFDFTGALDGRTCGGGCYSVAITPDPEHPAFRHRLDSTGELDGRRLTLGALVERRELFTPVLVSGELTMERSTVNGSVHCNHGLTLRGPHNRVLPAGGLPGALTYSCPDHKIFWGEGACIEAGGASYSAEDPLPESWRRDPIPRPEIDLEHIRSRYSFAGQSGDREWRTAPRCGGVLEDDGRVRQYLHIVEGALRICPGEGEQFIFEGIAVVDRDVEIAGRGTIILEGMILSGGELSVKNGVNAGQADKTVVLAAEGDLQVFGDQHGSTENPVFGGDLLLLSTGGAVTIGHQKMKGEQFIMHGTIFAKKIAICNCDLTHIAEPGDVRWRYFPAYGMVVTSWMQP